jgi:uncharacterized membrane protein YbhN (UPF0104 family)
MRRTMWAWGRLVGPAAVLAVLVWRLGTGAFVDGIRTVNGGALAAAAGLLVLSTVCSAWRWKIVARGLGVELSLPAAVAAYYRAVFLNLTLPGGVVGDVHRGVSHGREVSDVGRALRAVAWERVAGQLVQALLTVVVLPPGDARSAWTRARSALAGDIRDALLARRAWLGIALASVIVIGGHVAIFLVAARTAGTTAPMSTMLPIAFIVMLAAALPNVGGWGPREGVTAWLFSAAGLHAQRGVATAVVYGVLVLVASLPGAAVLVVAWLRGTPLRTPTEPLLRKGAAHA